MSHQKKTIGFIAYPSRPDDVGETIEEAISRCRNRTPCLQLESWIRNDIAGRMIYSPVKAKIRKSDMFVADVTSLNLNVAYEIGYAIGCQKRVILIRNTRREIDGEIRRKVGIFETFGYIEYQNSQDLVEKLLSIADLSPIKVDTKLNTSMPVFILLPESKTNWIIHLKARINKTRLYYRAFDPDEQVTLPIMTALHHVASSYGVVVPFLEMDFADSVPHNLRGAFVAGVAHGTEKHLLLVQKFGSEIPLDYRDEVKVFRRQHQLNDFVHEFFTSVVETLQSTQEITTDSCDVLAEIDLGQSTAENEARQLHKYYLKTDEFRRALRGEARVLTGRKGTGKTAIFDQVRHQMSSQKSVVIVDVKPEGYQLKKFKELVLDYLEQGTKEHTITAFWEYVLLLETCYRILRDDKDIYLRNKSLYEPYQALHRLYYEGTRIAESDFFERMVRLIDSISNLFHSRYKNQKFLRFTEAEITSFLYSHDIHNLITCLDNYIRQKTAFWILIDNLDKGWPAHGLNREDVVMIRCLLDATRKIERTFENSVTDCHTLVFLRNDIYELLVQESPDRGKESRLSLDWRDDDLLREMVRRRLVYSAFEKSMSFQDVWRKICCPFVQGQESSQYLIDRSLMRPRFLLNLINHCKGSAITLGHKKIEEEDIERGLTAFSSELVLDVNYEISSILSDIEDVLYVVLGQRADIRHDELISLLLRRQDFTQAMCEHVIDILLWYGVLGLVREGHGVSYIFSTNYDSRKMSALIQKIGKENVTYEINPAFWPALEIDSVSD